MTLLAPSPSTARNLPLALDLIRERADPRTALPPNSNRQDPLRQPLNDGARDSEHGKNSFDDGRFARSDCERSKGLSGRDERVGRTLGPSERVGAPETSDTYAGNSGSRKRQADQQESRVAGQNGEKDGTRTFCDDESHVGVVSPASERALDPLPVGSNSKPSERLAQRQAIIWAEAGLTKAKASCSYLAPGWTSG